MLCADGSGHSVPISLEKIAVKILSEVDVRYCCHGTTKDALLSIKDQGLSRMKRQYIHFACSKKRLSRIRSCYIPEREELFESRP